jgi:hypothetical protein
MPSHSHLLCVVAAATLKLQHSCSGCTFKDKWCCLLPQDPTRAARVPYEACHAAVHGGTGEAIGAPLHLLHLFGAQL